MDPGKMQGKNTHNPLPQSSFFVYSRTVHLDIIKVFYLPIDAQEKCLKRILKFTLKQLLYVSVQ
jgi:hypothetical protein